MNETLKLEMVLTKFAGICYKIQNIQHSNEKGILRVFSFHFNESFSHDKLPVLKIYLTSEKNSFGLTQNVWFDGKVKQIQIKGNVFKQVNVKPKQTNYLKITTNCKVNSYFDCFEKLYMKKLYSNCQQKCSPYSLPTVPVCKTDNELICAKNVYDQLYANISFLELQCPQSCSILQYSAEESWTSSTSTWWPYAKYGNTRDGNPGVGPPSSPGAPTPLRGMGAGDLLSKTPGDGGFF